MSLAHNRNLMNQLYEEALTQDVGDHEQLSTLDFSGYYEHEPDWAVGPFRKEEKLTFKLLNY